MDEKEGRTPSPLPSPQAPPLIQKRLLQGVGSIGGDAKEIEGGVVAPHMKGGPPPPPPAAGGTGGNRLEMHLVNALLIKLSCYRF